MSSSASFIGAAARTEVSVILPFYNGAAWLRGSIESVRSQQGVEWELIVVDDGSPERADEVIAQLRDDRIRLIRIQHAGKGAALNAGIRHSRADQICFIDQDDLMLPGRLSLQVQALNRAAGLDGVYSDYERRCGDGRPIDIFTSRQVAPEEAIHLMAIGQSPVTMQTLLLKKRRIEALGGFSERLELTGLDDVDFFVRLFLARPLLRYIPGIVQAWVRHDKNFSGSAAFHEARLHWLQQVRDLAARHPMLRRESRNFVFHARTMRGIHCLERHRPRQAFAELLRAARARPSRLNTYYLLLKAMVLSVRPTERRAQAAATPQPLP
jgi:glycosyltransferase involved in cell wall biosynthesis